MGVKNFSNNEKRIKTNIERYGCAYPVNSEEGQQKSRETKLRKYGDPFYSNEEKRKKTLESYSDEEKRKWVEKAHQTSLKKYGVEHYSKTDEFRKLSSKIWKQIWKNEDFCQRMSELSKSRYKQVVKKIIESNMMKYGVRYYFESEEAKKHRKNSIEYNSIIFDSKLEIQFYSWCIENNLKIEVHPEIYFVYDDNGIKRKYFPDFIVNDSVIVETKGDHFFRTNEHGEMEMFLPFRYDFWDDNTYIRHCQTMNNKYKCMLANNVMIITGKNIKNLNREVFVKQPLDCSYLPTYQKMDVPKEVVSDNTDNSDIEVLSDL